MSTNIIVYPPGGGGNHLRNLCGLNGRFVDQWPWPWVKEHSVGLRPYWEPIGPPGEVHSLPGRNIHEVFIEHIEQNPDGDYILQGHYGELAPWADKIRKWNQVHWLVITMDQEIDRQLLRDRQQRLQYHPYWLDEEQIYLYRPEMYQYYFNACADLVWTLPVSHLWQTDIAANGVLSVLASAFGIIPDLATAQDLHLRWCDLNFGQQ
jgi:hypothetical protein